jgi:DHA1 family inner membrane transport protein
LDRTSTGWIAPACGWRTHSTFFFLGQSIGPIYYRIGIAKVGLMPSLWFGALMVIVTGLVCAIWLRGPSRGSGRA